MLLFASPLAPLSAHVDKQTKEDKLTVDCSDIKQGKVGALRCSNIPCTHLQNKLDLPAAAHTSEYKLSCAAHAVISLHTPVHNIQSQCSPHGMPSDPEKKSENMIQINNFKGCKVR